MFILLAQSEAVQSQTLETLNNVLKAGVIGLAVFALVALILGLFLGGKIISQLLALLNRVTSALEKLSDQAEAQSGLMGEIGVGLRDNKASVDEMKKQIRINTKVSKDYMKATNSNISILNRALVKAETFFTQRIEEIEKLLQRNHAELLTALNKPTPEAQLKVERTTNDGTTVTTTASVAAVPPSSDLLEAKTESEKPP